MASTLTDYLSTVGSALTTSGGGQGQSGVDPFGVLANIYDTVEIRSNAAPPMTLNIKDLGGAPSPASQYLQPTLIFSGPAGRYVYAPYGEAGQYTGTLTSLGSLAAIAVVGFLVGRATK